MIEYTQKFEELKILSQLIEYDSQEASWFKVELRARVKRELNQQPTATTPKYIKLLLTWKILWTIQFKEHWIFGYAILLTFKSKHGSKEWIIMKVRKLYVSTIHRSDIWAINTQRRTTCILEWNKIRRCKDEKKVMNPMTIIN